MCNFNHFLLKGTFNSRKTNNLKRYFKSNTKAEATDHMIHFMRRVFSLALKACALILVRAGSKFGTINVLGQLVVETEL